MLVYCDYIAYRIQKALLAAKNDNFADVPLTEVSKVNYDIGPAGEFRSTAKTLFVVDGNGRRYQVTVKEL
jgi:hypothetical protein